MIRVEETNLVFSHYGIDELSVPALSAHVCPDCQTVIRALLTVPEKGYPKSRRFANVPELLNVQSFATNHNPVTPIYQSALLVLTNGERAQLILDERHVLAKTSKEIREHGACRFRVEVSDVNGQPGSGIARLFEYLRGVHGTMGIAPSWTEVRSLLHAQPMEVEEACRSYIGIKIGEAKDAIGQQPAMRLTSGGLFSAYDFRRMLEQTLALKTKQKEEVRTV
jgi:hypothetical protein